MANIPLTTRFIGIADTVNLVEKKSSQINSETEPYTMQDIIDSVPVSPSGPSAGIYIIQQGSNANPTIVQTALDQLGLINMTRIATGIYEMNFPANTFDAAVSNAVINVKYPQFYTLGASQYPTIVAYVSGDSQIQIYTYDSSGTFADSVLDYTEINITVFN